MLSAARRGSQRAYERLLRANARQNGRDVPTTVERYYVSLTGWEYASAVRRFVGAGQRVLLVGDGGGRDYYGLRSLGKEVHVVDIAPQRLLPDLVIADVQEPLPYPDGHFDAVVMAEVIEHLFDDVRALDNVRRVLREDGALILTVPFLNDEPEFHARVHTPASLRRLLQHAGWRITDWEIKGGGFAWLDTVGAVRLAKHALAYGLWRTTGRLPYESINARLAAVDRGWGRTDHLLHRRSPYYGVFVRAVKGAATDFATIQQREFTDYQDRSAS